MARTDARIQNLVTNSLTWHNRFLWAEQRDRTAADSKAFRDAVYQAVARLRRRGWRISSAEGIGYYVEHRGL